MTSITIEVDADGNLKLTSNLTDPTQINWMLDKAKIALLTQPPQQTTKRPGILVPTVVPNGPLR